MPRMIEILEKARPDLTELERFDMATAWRAQFRKDLRRDCPEYATEVAFKALECYIKKEDERQRALIIAASS